MLTNSEDKTIGMIYSMGIITITVCAMWLSTTATPELIITIVQMVPEQVRTLSEVCLDIDRIRSWPMQGRMMSLPLSVLQHY